MVDRAPAPVKVMAVLRDEDVADRIYQIISALNEHIAQIIAAVRGKIGAQRN